MNFVSILPPIGWGVNSSLIGHSSKKIGALATGIGAQFLGLLVTTSLFIFFPSLNLPTHAWLPLIFNGVIGALLFWALCHIFSIAPASVVTPIIASWTIIAAILGVFFQKDSFSLLKLLAMAIVVLGIALLTLDFKTLLKKRIKIITPGTGIAVLLSLGLGINALISTFVIKEIGWLSASVGIRTITVLVMSVIIFLQRKSIGYRNDWIKSRLVWIIAALDVLAFSSFNLALTSTSISIVSILAALGPLVTAATSVILFKERPSAIQVVGAFTAVTGVILFQV